MIQCVKLMLRIFDFEVLLFDCFVYCQNVTCLKRFTRYGQYAGEVEDIIVGRLAVQKIELLIAVCFFADTLCNKQTLLETHATKNKTFPVQVLSVSYHRGIFLIYLFISFINPVHFVQYRTV